MRYSFMTFSCPTATWEEVFGLARRFGYDGVEPLGDAERRAIAEAPAYDDELRSELGLARTEGNGKSF